MSSNSKVLEKRKKIANSGSVEESSSDDPTKNKGKPRDQSESMSPRRNSWREKIRNIKGWRDELNDRKKSKDLGPKKSKLCDRVNKMCSRSRFSRSRNFQRYERLPMRPRSKTSLIKDASLKKGKERKKIGKSVSKVSKVGESSGVEVDVSVEKVAGCGDSEADKKNKADIFDGKPANKSYTKLTIDDQESTHNQRVQHLTVENMIREEIMKIKPAAVDLKLWKNRQDGRNDVTNEKEVNTAVQAEASQSGQIGSHAALYDCLNLNQKNDGLDTSHSVVNTEL